MSRSSLRGRGHSASGRRSGGTRFAKRHPRPLARLALNAGKHVVVDKPFSIWGARADRAGGRKQRLLSVFHNRRWDSDYLGIKQAIEQG